MMETQGERLKSIIKLYNSTMAAFEKNCRLCNGSISMPIRKGIDFSTATISKICQNYPINEYWLYSGQGEVFKEDLNFPEHIVKTLYELGIDFHYFEAEYGLLPGTVINKIENYEKENDHILLKWAKYLEKYAQDNNFFLDFSWTEESKENDRNPETPQTTQSMKESNNNPRLTKTERVKRNFFLSQNISSTIDILSKYRRCNQGTIIEEALNQYLSKEEIQTEVKKAIQIQKQFILSME